jgi:hypothetical protein
MIYEMRNPAISPRISLRGGIRGRVLLLLVWSYLREFKSAGLDNSARFGQTFPTHTKSSGLIKTV